MSGLVQAIEAVALFYLFHRSRSQLLPEDYSPLVLVPYYLVLTWGCFKFAMSYKNSRLPKNDFSVAIIGAGVSGVAMAIKLKEIGVKFRIIEKEKRLGGTWWLNQYPGCACDVPSHIYSYSFNLNPNWSRSYSRQAEILKYVEDTVDKYKIRDHIELGKKVTRALWDESTKRWRVELSSGEYLTANAVVSCVGALHVPSKPDFPGAGDFRGEVFHSAEWPAGWDPAGKRVAVIGTGASAVQIVPSIADKVSSLTVFQRTACWVPPKDDFRHPEWLKFLFRIFPPLMYLLRCLYFWRAEFFYLGVFRLNGFLRKRARAEIKRYFRKAVKDPEVRAKLTPNFELGCKRVTPSNSYLQSFNRDNVRLVTESIKEFTAGGIRTVDGETHEVDTIIYATGFSIMDNVRSVPIYRSVPDKKSRVKTLAEEWGEHPVAYKGITCAGYPNAFFLLGPGTGLGHNTIIFMIECQMTYVVDAITKMVKQNVKAMDVRPDAVESYKTWTQEWMKNKAFNSPSCMSYYKNAEGVNWTLWPSHLTHYWWETRGVDFADYVLTM